MALSSLFVIFFVSWLIRKKRQKNIFSPTAGIARGHQGKTKRYFKVNSGRGFAEVFGLANKGFILKQ